jgi:PKD domain
MRPKGWKAGLGALALLCLPAAQRNPAFASGGGSPGEVPVLAEADAPWNAPVAGVPGPTVLPRRLDVSRLPPAPEGPVVPALRPVERREPRTPHALPIPPGATILREASPPVTTRIAERAAAVPPAPPLDASFEALVDNGSAFPPDTNGAAGPSQLVAMLNSQVRIQDRGGVEVKTVTIESFWGKSATAFLTDPRVLYDPHAGRWIAVILSGVVTPAGGRTKDLLVAVSDDSDASGKWSIYDTPVNGTGETFNADFPTLGYSRDRLVVQINLYDAKFENFEATRIYVYARAPLESGSASTPTVITTAEFGSTQTPAVAAEADATDLFLLEDWFGGDPEGGVMRLFAITGPAGSEALTPIAFVGARNRWDDFVATPTNFGPQKGSTTGVSTNDANVTSTVVYRDGFLWAAHTIFIPADAPTRTAIQWWQIATDGTIAQHGILDDPSGKSFFAFPSIAVNRDDHVLIACARFSADDFPGAVYTYRAAADADGTLREPLLLKAGEGTYEHVAPKDDRNRWGDYSAAAVDPVDDSGFWTIQEFAKAGASPAASLWDTWWGHVTAEAPVAPSAGFDVVSAEPTQGVPVAFHDSSAGGPTSWLWDFGDGTSSREKNPSKTYSAPGSFTVSLRASNRIGAQTSSRTVTILPTPQRLRPDPPSRRRTRRVVDRPPT